MTREEFWQAAYLTALEAGNTLRNSADAADQSLDAYSRRFPQPKPPEIEEPVKLSHTCGICLTSYDACNCKELGYR